MVLNLELRHRAQTQNTGDKWRHSIFKKIVCTRYVPKNVLCFLYFLQYVELVCTHFFPQHQPGLGFVSGYPSRFFSPLGLRKIYPNNAPVCAHGANPRKTMLKVHPVAEQGDINGANPLQQAKEGWHWQTHLQTEFCPHHQALS
jgi:hypothetical protein